MDAAFEIFVRALKDTDPNVRKDAAQRLAWLGAKSRAAVLALLEALQDPVRDVRLWAASAIPRIAPGAAKPCLPLLIEGLTADGELWHQENAAASLHRLGRPPAEALPALVHCLQLPYDPTDSRDGPEQPIKNENTGDVRESVVEALGEIGKAARAALPALKKRLEGAPMSLQLKLATAMARIES